MERFNKIQDIKTFLRHHQRNGKSIGLVPTMGYLHEGHLSLIKKASEENHIVVLSIFVNPTQFGPNEDLDNYPRNLERDILLAKEAGANVVFTPSADEMYKSPYRTYVYVNKLTEKLCGISRPEHFEGVTTIVTKLFNIVRPDRAYFGQKDAQQVIVIKQMVCDLDMDLEIMVCPIVREADGLAKSSRNTYLNTEERIQAVVLSQSLQMAKKMIEDGEKDAVKMKAEIENEINSKSLSSIDYVSIVDAKTLEDVNIISDTVLIALAVQFGNTRLIDNTIVGYKKCL